MSVTPPTCCNDGVHKPLTVVCLVFSFFSVRFSVQHGSAWGGESAWLHTSSVTPPTVVRLMFSLGWRVSMGPHKQCDPSHCREVDVQLGVASQHGSTQAV